MKTTFACAVVLLLAGCEASSTVPVASQAEVDKLTEEVEKLREDVEMLRNVSQDFNERFGTHLEYMQEGDQASRKLVEILGAKLRVYIDRIKTLEKKSSP